MISEEAVDSALQYLRDSAKEAAVARSQALTLKKYVEIVEAQEKVKWPELTNTAAQDQARASKEYMVAYQGWQESVRKDCEFRMLREAASSRVEAWRTQSSNQRAGSKI